MSYLNFLKQILNISIYQRRSGMVLCLQLIIDMLLSRKQKKVGVLFLGAGMIIYWKQKKKIIEKKVYREVINSENILSKLKWIIRCLAAWRKRIIIQKNSLNIFPLNKEKPRILVNFIFFQKFLKAYTMSQDEQLFRIAAYKRKNGLNLLDYHLKTLMQRGWSYIENSGDFITKARNLGSIPEMIF